MSVINASSIVLAPQTLYTTSTGGIQRTFFEWAYTGDQPIYLEFAEGSMRIDPDTKGKLDTELRSIQVWASTPYSTSGAFSLSAMDNTDGLAEPMGRNPSLQVTTVSPADKLVVDQGGVSKVVSVGAVLGTFNVTYNTFTKMQNKIGDGATSEIGVVNITSAFGDDGSGAWKNAGYFTGKASNKCGGILESLDVIGKKLSESRFLFAFTYNGTAGAGGAIISSARSSELAGISIIATSGALPTIGSLYVNMVDDSLASTPCASTTTQNTVIADSTDHNCAVYIDGFSGSVFTYVDGVLQDSFVGILATDATFGSEFCLLTEHNSGSVATSTSNANKVKNLHAFDFSDAPVNNVSYIVASINSSPSEPYSGLIEYSKLPVTIGVVGQSNEESTTQSGYRLANRSRGVPFLNKFGSPNWLPSIAQRLGESLYSPFIKTSAVGGSSLAISWAGMCRTWFSGVKVLRGSYILSDGGLWKSTNTSSILSTVAPVGTSSYTTSDTIPWTYVGVATAEDTDRHVYSNTSSRFDPNGYVASVIAHVGRFPTNQKIVYVSIGQTDCVEQTSRAEYGNAMEAVCRKLSPYADRIFAGYTLSAGTASDAWADANLIPAIGDALGNMATLGNVVEGVNLRQELGTLSTTVLSNSLGLWDTMHANPYTLKKCGRLWGDLISGYLDSI